MKKIEPSICFHGFTIGYCPRNCILYQEEDIQQKRKEFIKMFKKRELKNPITKQTYILKLRQFSLLERYPLGVPENMIVSWK